ncbi:hypothetical protein ARMSODRAFT_1018064 [Armillaria solidipes]|uniref:Uncharacterized protein n=1 Tax=Armillaria solidipes TaxID=1076256 RepID=A0A2H3C5F7_9AGAR|nr:hypothetical protein ARMSODRAFT_1018064 [Armillaria solidipes]
MALKKKFSAAWRRREGLTDAWDRRTPRQVFRQQQGLAGIWDHFGEEGGRFAESGEEDGRFTESTVSAEELE